ncbi:MAG: hypothetical protein IRZ16_16775 [Myxococcaceae bacterium]|nr:hypothetical protein [Myxococcaceae bacterium]
MVHGGAVAVPGQALEAIVRIGPDHLLYVQSATVELVALELDAQGNPRVLDVVSVPFAPGVRLEGPVEERVLLRVPSPWPLTMKSPDITGVARHPVETRLRLSIDVAAHPLLEREAEVVISAPA